MNNYIRIANQNIAFKANHGLLAYAHRYKNPGFILKNEIQFIINGKLVNGLTKRYFNNNIFCYYENEFIIKMKVWDSKLWKLIEHNLTTGEKIK